MTFLTAIPKEEVALEVEEEDVVEGDEWDPGETVSNSVDVLTGIGQWVAMPGLSSGSLLPPSRRFLGQWDSARWGFIARDTALHSAEPLSR